MTTQDRQDDLRPTYVTITKPLTADEIYSIWKTSFEEEAKVVYPKGTSFLEKQPFIYFARALERAHGIGE